MTAPYGLQNRAEQARRRELLARPHMADLTEFVEEIRRKEGLSEDVPYFDPADGGSTASILFLLKAPGPRAVESGFVSHDNPDPSAANFLELLADAELSRSETVTWNLIPWALRDRSGNVRAVAPEDEEDALPYLRQLFPLLPRLRVVVLMGKDAHQAGREVRKLTRARIVETHLTAARVLNSDARRREQILEQLRRAKELAGI